MQSLNIKGEEFTPSVQFNDQTNELLISGISVPEDTKGFYQPVLTWLDTFLQENINNAKLTIGINLEYFNTSSSKVIYDMIAKLERNQKEGSEFKVKWYYNSDDEDMLESGNGFSEILKIPFEFIAL